MLEKLHGLSSEMQLCIHPTVQWMGRGEGFDLAQTTRTLTLLPASPVMSGVKGTVNQAATWPLFIPLMS